MRGRNRREPRLDPVRWHRPGRPALLRSAVVAALVTTAATVMWAGPGTCSTALAAPAPPVEAVAAPAPPVKAVTAPAPPVKALAAPSGGTLVATSLAAEAPAALGLSAAAPSCGEAPAVRPSSVRAPSQTGDVRAPGASGRDAVPPGRVGVPIRLAEPAGLDLIRPGDHVDVFRVAEPGTTPQAVASAALVLDVTGADDPTTGGLLLALTPEEARRTVQNSGVGYAVLIRPD